MANKAGKAVILRELDNQYTVSIYARDSVEGARVRLQSTTPNLTLANAFNSARDSLAALAVGGEVHEEITITTRIESN